MKKIKKVKKLKKVKKVSLKRLKHKLDILFSNWIRTTGFCQAENYHIKCGGPLQTAHIVTRANMRLRFEEKNTLCICAGHHIFFHREPILFVSFIQEKFPVKFEFVKEHQREINKWTPEDYEREIQILSKKLSDILI